MRGESQANTTTPASHGSIPAAESEALPVELPWLDRVFDLVAVVSLPDLRLYALNRAGRSLLQRSLTEPIASLPWAESFAPKTWESLLRYGVPAALGGRSWRGAGMLVRTGGRELPVRLSCWGTTARRAVIAAIDDTPAHTLQMVLRHEQTLLHALLNTLPDSIYFKDLESRFVRANLAIAAKMGVTSPEVLIGRTDFDFFTQEHAMQAFRDEQRIIATGEPVLEVVEKETWPDGHVTWVSTSKFPLRDAHGTVVGTFGLSRDITESKRAEEGRRALEAQHVQAQKMESIGRIAAGVAHEINTPTQFINDNVRFLGDAFAQLAATIAAYQSLGEVAASHPATHSAAAFAAARAVENELPYLLEEIPRTVAETSDGIARITRIVRSLRDYSHPGTLEKAPVDLNRVVETVVAVSRHEWKLVADVVTELDPALPLVSCVSDQISQALLNIVINAAHAVGEVVARREGERGCITVRTRREGDEVCLEISDTGAGIPAAVRPHIFEPFVTTKAPGQGTGQGLALVHTFVTKNHGGRVDFTTETDRGTTFVLRLPLDAPPPAPTTPAQP